MTIKKPPVYKCINPMMAASDESRLTSQKINYKSYALQEKFDGTRGLLFKRGDFVKGIIGRNCNTDFLENFPEIVEEALKIPARSFTLDGEITFFNDKDHPFFLTARATYPQKRKYKVRYMVFDILEVDGESLKNKTFEKRREILKSMIPGRFNYIKIVPTYYTPSKYRDIYKKILRRGGEGVMLKKKRSKYIEGDREHWLKIKKKSTEDCAVFGITEGSGRRKSITTHGNPRPMFGALVLGQYHRGRLYYVGNVGAGLSDDIIKFLYTIIDQMPPAHNPFNEKVYNVKKFIKPKVVVEVDFLERTADRKLRLPVFKRIRIDKDPADCTF